MYAKIVTDHFSNPRNIGLIEKADGVGSVGMPFVGDIITFFIRVKDDRIEQVQFISMACRAATAVASILSEVIVGRGLDEALSATGTGILARIGREPSGKKAHCLNLGSEALRLAIEDYRSKIGHNLSAPTAKLPEACDSPMCSVHEAEQCIGLFSGDSVYKETSPESE